MPPREPLSLAEGLAVGALIHGGIGFMGAHQDSVQRAVVCVVAVVCAGLDGAFDALIGLFVHAVFLLFCEITASMPHSVQVMRRKKGALSGTQQTYYTKQKRTMSICIFHNFLCQF